MGTLVICPTCKNKLSINADHCPHCGENQFFGTRRVRRRVKCDKCGGTGSYYEKKYSVGSTPFEDMCIVTRETLRYFRSGENILALTKPIDGNYMEFQVPGDTTTYAININNYSKHNVAIRNSIKRRNFKISPCNLGYGYGCFFNLEHNKIVCSRCCGSKLMIVEVDEAYDLREAIL